MSSRTVTVNSAISTWNYGTAVTDPNGNDEVHVFSQISAGSVVSAGTYETSVSYYQGSASAGKLLRQVLTDYAAEQDSVPAVSLSLVNVRPIRKTITLDNGLVAKTETDYETFILNGITATRLNPTEIREYAYGNGAPGPLLRRTDYTYLHNANPTYATLNIVDRPASIIVYDGSGNVVCQTTYEYDVYNHTGMPAMQASGAVQHDSVRTTNYVTRGNQTGISKWRNTDGTWLTTNIQYDDAGNVIASRDPNGNLTQFDYTDSWISIAGTTGGNACAPSGQGKAFPTRVTNALNQITTHAYYSCTGALGSTTDPNNLTAWSVYDLFGRTVQVHAPDGGQTTNCYTDTGGTGCQPSAPPFRLVTTKSISASVNEIATTVFDGLARLTQTQLNSDPDGPTYVDTTYDALGRKYTVSNPYRTGSDPGPTNGVTTFLYDALGRTCLVVPPDSTPPSGTACPTAAPANDTLTTYSGNTTTVTDQAGENARAQVTAWAGSRKSSKTRLATTMKPTTPTTRWVIGRASSNTAGSPARAAPVHQAVM